MAMSMLKRANPNNHGHMYLETDGQFYYVDLGDGGDPFEFDCLQSATEFFDESVADLVNVPNWEMQAKYDELHGTDNGGDPRCELPPY